MEKATVRLNPHLIERQKLSQKRIDNLLDLHRRLDEYIDTLKKAKETLLVDKNNAKALKLKNESVQKIRKFEFKMQKQWKFNKLIEMHTHWTRNPFCSCNTNTLCEVHNG